MVEELIALAPILLARYIRPPVSAILMRAESRPYWIALTPMLVVDVKFC